MKTPKQTAKACLVLPNVDDASLTQNARVVNYKNEIENLPAVVEKPLTIFLNSQEIVTLMTIRDHPKWLAIGYLLNQNMLLGDDEITATEYDQDLGVMVIRTKRKTDYEKKLRKKTQTSGCSVGTVFGDLMEKFEEITLPVGEKITTTELQELLTAINTTPTLYLKAGAIHGCVLCKGAQPLVFMEDVGRHNAVDKIAGYMFCHKLKGDDRGWSWHWRQTLQWWHEPEASGLRCLAIRQSVCYLNRLLFKPSTI